MSKSKNESCFSVCFSIVNFILGCRWLRKTKILWTSDSLLKRPMISSTYFDLFYCPLNLFYVKTEINHVFSQMTISFATNYHI